MSKKVIYIIGPERIHTLVVDARKDYDERKPAVAYEHWSRDLKVTYPELQLNAANHFVYDPVHKVVNGIHTGFSVDGYRPLDKVVIHAESYKGETV